MSSLIFKEIYGNQYRAISKLLNNKSQTDRDGLYKIDTNLKAKLEAEYGLYNDIKKENTTEEEFTDITFMPEIKDTLKAANEDGGNKAPWVAIDDDGYTPLSSGPENIITNDIAKWLEAVKLDKRMRLFSDEEAAEKIGRTKNEEDTQTPLFSRDDLIYFDRSTDGDNFEDEKYISSFRKILDAVKTKQVVHIKYRAKSGKYIEMDMLPDHLEYSVKDDRFRVLGIEITEKYKRNTTINLGTVLECEGIDIDANEIPQYVPREKVYVEFDVYNQGRNNVLERVMLHFAHFKKRVDPDAEDENTYHVKVYYDEGDYKEMVIRDRKSVV